MKDKKSQKEAAVKKLPVKKKYIFTLVIVFAFLISLFVAYSYFDSVITDKNKEAIVDEGFVISSGTGNGFPLTFTSNDIINVDSISSRMMILTKKLLTSVSASGKVNYLAEFTYVEPTMITGEKYGIVYDRSSARYMLFDKNQVVFNGETQDKSYIITADINDTGKYVLVTKSNNSACNVNIFDRNGESVYIWTCSDEYIVCVDISDDGEDIICAGIGAVNGEIYTKVYHLNIYEGKHVSEHLLEGSAVVDIRLNGKDNVIVSCDNSRQIIDLSNKEKAVNVVKYTSDALACDSNESGYTAVLNNKFGSFDKKQVTVYDKKNTVVYKSEFSSEASDIICNGKKVYILSENSIIETYNGKSEILAETQTNGKGLVVCENKLYYYSQGSLFTGK